MIQNIYNIRRHTYAYQIVSVDCLVHTYFIPMEWYYTNLVIFKLMVGWMVAQTRPAEFSTGTLRALWMRLQT